MTAPRFQSVRGTPRSFGLSACLPAHVPIQLAAAIRFPSGENAAYSTPMPLISSSVMRTEHATGVGVPEPEGRLEPGRSRGHESTVGREDNPAAPFPNVIAYGAHGRQCARRQRIAIKVGCANRGRFRCSVDDSWLLCDRGTRPRRTEPHRNDDPSRQEPRIPALHAFPSMSRGTRRCHLFGSTASAVMRNPVTVICAVYELARGSSCRRSRPQGSVSADSDLIL